MFREPTPEDFEIVINATMEFEIIGIYEPRRELQLDGDSGFGSMDEFQENTMFVLNQSVFNISDIVIRIS